MQGKLIYEFGQFRLDPQERQLWRDGKPVSLSPQLFSLLLVFVQTPGHLLSKEELRNKVWGKAYVSEDALKVIIGNLRKILGNGNGEAQSNGGNSQTHGGGNGNSYIENVRGEGYRFVGKVRKLEPASPSLTIAGPQEVGVAAPAASSPRKGLSRQRLFLTLASCLVAILILASVLYYRALTQRPQRTQTATTTDLTTRKAVAVLPFRNLSGKTDDAWLSAAFPEWLTSEIGAGGQLRVISGEQIATVQRDLFWPRSGDSTAGYPAEKLAQLSRNTGAEAVITGAFADSNSDGRAQIRIDLKILDSSTGQVLASVQETGDRADLFTLANRAGASLRERLGLLQISPGDAQSVRATLPANEKAARLYIQGLEKFRALDPMAASRLLQQTIESDSKYPLAHSALAQVWSAVGYELEARDEAGKALELASGLPRQQYLEIEGTYREAAKDWTRAVQIYQTLSMFAPDNLDYGLRLAKMQINGGHGKEALATLMALSKSHAASDDPRIDHLEAKAYESLGDFQNELSAAERAITTGRERNAWQLVGNAMNAKSWALDNLGRAKEAEAVGREEEKVYASIGDTSGVGWALKNIADALGDEGNHAEAIAGYQLALEYFRKVGNEHGVVIALNNMGFDLKDSGDLESAKRAFGEAIAVCEKTGDTRSEVLAFNGLGTILYREGNLSAARKMYESALVQFRTNGDQDREARMLRNIALALEGEGELGKARATFEEAIALDRQIDSKAELAASLENEGELLLLQGDISGAQIKCEEAERISHEVEDNRNQGYALVGIAKVLHVRAAMPSARAKYEAAMNIRTHSGEKGLAAETALLIAEFELDNSNPQAAEIQAKQAVEEFAREKRIDEQAAALAMLANVHLQQGNLATAEQEVRTALDLAGKTQDRGTRLRVALVAAQVHAAAGNLQKAVGELRVLIHECEKYGYLGPELEIRLALAETELKIDRLTGQSSLEAVAKRAKEKGFLLIANKAANAAAQQRLAVK